MKKRMLSIFLALILIVSNLSSTTAFGAEGSAAGENIILNGGQYLTNSAADPVTNTGIPAGFGTAASAGRIWTDKSVIANNDGSFGITLSTLAQEYMSTTSGTGVGGSTNTAAIAADVTLILDMSTSMSSNSDITPASGSTKLSRIKAMQMAANNAIKIILDANPNNRVAVHWFGGYLSGTHVGTLLPMNFYKLSDGGDEYFTLSGTTLSTNNKLQTKEGTAYPVVSKATAAGTPTQDGITYGVSKAIDDINKTTASSIQRKPYVLLLSDGAAIQGHRDYNTIPMGPAGSTQATSPIDVNAYTVASSTKAYANILGDKTKDAAGTNKGGDSASASYGSANIAAATILTGMYMKEQLNTAYSSYNGNNSLSSTFYTIGLGSDSAIKGSSSNSSSTDVYAWAGLDPQNVYTYANNWNSVPSADQKAPYKRVADTTQTVITSFANTYGGISNIQDRYVYSNYYTFADSYNAVLGAFNQLAADVESTTTILPLVSKMENVTLDESIPFDLDSAITFVDEIGEGFTVDSATLKITLGTGAVTAALEESKSLDNGTRYELYGFSSNSEYKSKVVTKTVNNITSLYWYIDADDMSSHIYYFKSRTNPVAGQYNSPSNGAFHLTYNVKPSITAAPNEVTQTTYFTNAVATDEGGAYTAKTSASFQPGDDNPYYEDFTERAVSKSGIGAAYVSQESLSDGLLTMKLGNNGKLDLVMGIVKSGPETVSTGEDFEYTVTLYNYTNEDRTNLTVTSDGQTQTGINVPAHGRTELTFPSTAPDTEQTLTSDAATVPSLGLISNTVDTEVTALPLYTVKFDSKGGSTVNDEQVRSGSAVSEPTDPEWAGHVFEGWYQDETYTTPWDFISDKVTEDNTILYAKWNTVPVAQDDTATTPYETAVTGKVKATDEDLSDTLLYEITTPPAHGTVTVDTDGNWNYTPTDGYHGEDQFTVTIKDQRGGEVTSAITVTVEKPVYTVTFNSKGGDVVAGYDKIVSGNTIIKPEDPGRPGHIFEGWYKDDAYGTSWNFNTDTVTGNTTLFAKWNAIPVAQDDTVTTPNGKTVTGTVKVTDIDLDELSYKITVDSQYGTVTMDEDGNWTYKPGENFDGEDQFTVTIKDGRGGEATSIIKVTVEKPVYAVTFDSQGGAAVAGYDKVTSGNTIVKPGNPDWQGHIFKGWYKDAAGMVPWDFNTDTVTSNITLYAKWNTVPVAQDDTVATPYETEITGTVKVVDADSSDTLTYEITANPAHGTATVDTDGNWSYTPKDGYHGEDQFTITIDDGQGGITTSTINVTVKKPVYAVIFDSQGGSTVAGYDKVDSGSIISQPGNPSWLGHIFEGWFKDAAATLPWTFGTDTVTGNTTLYAKWNTIPTVNSPSVTTPYETAAVITVVGNDADGDSLTYDLKTPPAHGSVTKNSDGNFTYTPEDGYDGPDIFSVIVADGRDGTAVSNITITVEPKKVIIPDYNVTFDSMGGSSIDGYKVTEGVTINEPTAPDKPGFLFEGWYRDNAYSEKWNFNTDTITGDTILYAKWEENTPLSVDSPSVTTPYGEEKTGNVTVTSPGTGTLTYEKGKEPDHGSVTVNPDGSWSYKPADGFSGEDSFTVIVKDENGKEAASTITVTVEAKKGEPSKEPEPPTIIPEIPTTAPETPSPAPETPATPEPPTTPEPPITPEVPTIVPTPAPTTIPTPVNSKPAVSGSSHDTNYETPVSGQVKGQDADGDSLTYSLGSNPGNGTVTVNSDGSWTYTPNNGFTGNDSFTVKVEDGHGGSGTATIQIHVVRKLGIQLSASPDTIVADGKSTSALTATVTDSNNVPVAGVRVVFSAEKGSFPNGASAVTDAGGKASAIFKSEKIESVESHRIPVTATVNDSSKGLYAQGQIIITFEPASIKGTVIDNKTGTPVEGATVTVQKDFDNDGVVDFSSKATTSKDGTYRIPVPKGDITYEVLIETPRTINGKDQSVTFVQNSKAGNITGAANETFDSVKTAAGIILLKNSDGTESFLKDYSNYTIEILEKDKSGNQNSVVLDGGIYNAGAEKGTFRMEDLEKGKNYTFNIVYHFENGQSIIVGSVDVELNDDGQINISSVLIDPYGEITDSKTGKLIDGVKVTLYYADTERNSKAGRKAGEIVNLPAVTDFPPADNENPQLSDIYGKYAWMVFPDADYYIVAEKDGYAQFISDTISVGQEIVKYNFQMKNLKDAGATSDNSLDSQVTSIPKTGENLNLVYGLLLFTICFVFAAIRSQRRKAN